MVRVVCKPARVIRPRSDHNCDVRHNSTSQQCTKPWGATRQWADHEAAREQHHTSLLLSPSSSPSDTPTCRLWSHCPTSSGADYIAPWLLQCHARRLTSIHYWTAPTWPKCSCASYPPAWTEGPCHSGTTPTLLAADQLPYNFQTTCTYVRSTLW